MAGSRRLACARTAGDAGPLLSLADNYLGRSVDGTWASDVEANAVIGCLDRPEPKPPQRGAASSPTWSGSNPSSPVGRQLGGVGLRGHAEAGPRRQAG